MSDNQLLEAWVARRSDPAFAELMRRYVDLVYSAALRQVRDPELAEDVAQAVFLVLARKAPSLRRHAALAGWFFRTTRYVAACALRGEARRHRHEQEAATMNAQAQTPDSDESTWTRIAPLLDQAIAALPRTDRDAVLLRYFQAKPMHSVGEQLGVSEEAAKKRVTRAVDKLKDFFVRRGITLSATLLAGALGRSAVQAAPAGLATRIAAAQASAAGSGAAAALAAAALRQLFWLKMRWAAALCAGGLALLALVKALPPGSAPAQPPAANAQTAEAKPTLAPSSARQYAAETRSAKAASERVFWLNIRTAADNQPIPGTRVILNCWSEGRVDHEATFQSGTNGLCEMPVPTVAFDTFRVWVSAQGFVPKVMDWKPYELEGPITSYTMKLHPGLEIGGFIRNEQGRPISGARVNFVGPGADPAQRENVVLNSRLSVVNSDSSGRFTSHQMPSNPKFHIGLVVTHPDYAAQWLPIALPEGLQTNWVVVLSRGVALPGRVISTNGNAVARATVLVREPHGGADVSAKTDDNGAFTLAHLSEGPAVLEVTAAGFHDLKHNVAIENGAKPLVLELQPEEATAGETLQRQSIRLSGKVIDADSSEPIPRFTVLLNEHRGMPRDLLGEGHDGKFDWHSPLTFASEYTLEINAEGYEPQASSFRQRADGDQVFEFRLKQGGVLSGLVLQPNGQPVAGADVGLDGDEFRLYFELPARLVRHGNRTQQTTTDAKGLFSLKTEVGVKGIVVVHETGCGLVTARTGTNLVVQLAAWGAIEGTVNIGSKPAADQTVEVGLESLPYPEVAPRFHFRLEEKTGEDGRFRFARVPPGNYTVYRFINRHEGLPGPVGSSYGEPVTVLPGETAQVTVGGRGRAVIGQFVLSLPTTNYDWRAQWVALVQNRPDIPIPQKKQFPGISVFMDAAIHYASAIPKYYLEFQPDGSFRADDVLPGQYTLAVSITAPDPMGHEAWLNMGPKLGGVTNTVVMPPMPGERSDEPLNLGTILVPIKEAPALDNSPGKN